MKKDDQVYKIKNICFTNFKNVKLKVLIKENHKLSISFFGQ